MSTEVEQRVVEMRFDNKNFEKNVSETMSTLDKLKEKLNFRGVEKSFDGISSSARGVNLSPISGAVDTVMAKFSAFDAIVFSTLQNLTNRVIRAGEQLVKSLSVDQISAGWKKYGDETTAVQTIVNATGKSIDEVEKELEKLSWFTDETSYNYIDMVSNIGKFTSMNIPLDKAVTAMEGIANWAAVSGQGVNEASRAMYNLSQAIGVGQVKLQDWKSIENANMATAEFKNTAIETAKAMGLLTKAGKTVKGNLVDVATFSSTLQDEWFTSDVLMATLQKYGAYSDKVYEFTQTVEGGSMSCAEAMERVSAKGSELGAKAFKAAQEAKTLTEAIDSVKDAVSTGWKDTFKVIFGNYEQAKVLWTDLANELWDIFASGAEGRNTMFEEWVKLGGRDDMIAAMKNALTGLKKVIDVVKTAFGKIFPPVTEKTLKNVSSSIKKFTEKLILTDDKADKLQRTLQGLFAILDIIRIVVTDAAQIGLTIFNTLLGKSTDKIGTMTANMGDSIVSFRNWIKEHDHSVESIKKICDRIATVRKAIKDWIDDNFHLRDSLSKVGQFAKDIFSRLKVSYIEGGGGVAGIVEAIFDSLADLARGLFGFLERITGKDLSNITDRVVTTIQKMRNNVVDDISELPSKIGKLIDHFKTLDGLSFNNVKNAIKSLKDTIAGNFNKAGDSIDGFRSKLRDFGKVLTDKITTYNDFNSKWMSTSGGFKKYATDAKKKIQEVVDVGDLLAIALGGTLIFSIKTIGDAMKSLSKIMKSFTNPFDALTGVFKGLQKIEDAYIKKMSAQTMASLIKALAAALLVLIGIVIVLAELHKKGTLKPALLGLLALSGILIAMIAAVSAIQKGFKDFKSIVKIQPLILAISASLMILVGAIKILDSVDPDNLWRNIGVIALLAAGLVALTIVLTKCVKEVAGGALVMLAIAGSMYIMAMALVKLNDLDTDNIIKKLLAIRTAMKYLALVVFLSKGVGVGGALAILAVSFTLSGIIEVFTRVGKMDTSGILKNLWVLILAFGQLIALITIGSLAGEHASKGGIGVLAMSISLLIIIKAMERLSKMSIEDLKKGLTAVSIIMAIFGGISALSHFSGENASKAGVMILLMSASLLLIAGVVAIFSKIPEKELWSAVGAVAVLEIVFAGLIAVSKLASDSKNTMIGLAIAVAALSISLVLLSLIDWYEILPAAGALTLVMTAFAAMTAATRKIDAKAIATIVALGIIVAGLGYILYVLSDIPWESALASAGALSILILTISSAMFILGKSSSLKKGTMTNVAAMAGVVAILAVVLGGLSALNLQASIEQAASLGLLINAMALSILILGQVKSVSDDAINALMKVTGAVSILAIVLGIMNGLNMSASIEQAVSLGILINAMATSLVILDHVGYVSDDVLAAFGKITIVVGLLGGILTLLHHFNFSASIEDTTSLSILLLAMSVVTAILSKVGQGSLSAAAEGAAAFDAVIVIIGGLLVAIGALFSWDKFSKGDEFLDKGIEVLIKLGKGIGEFVGALVGGVANAALPAIGTALSGFMKNLQPFFEGSKNASGDALDGVKNLAKMIMVISAASIVDGIARFISFGANPIKRFTKDLKTLGKGLADYSEIITKKKIDVDAISNSADAAVKLAEFASAIPRTGGLAQALAGSKDISEFIRQLNGDKDGEGGLAKALIDYSKTVESATINYDAIDNSITAGARIAELAESIPSTGGLLQKITGVKDLAQFARALSGDGENDIGLAQALSDYSQIIKGNKFDAKAVTESAKAAKALAEFVDALPARDGKLQEWIGNKESLSSFAFSLVGDQYNPGFVDAIVGYCEKLKEGHVDAKAITNSVNAGKALAGLEDSLPESNGKIKSLFVGDKQSLIDFASQLEAFGEAMATYSTKIKDIKAESVVASANAARMLVATAEVVEKNDIDKKTFDGFGIAMSSLADKIMAFYTSMESVDDAKLSSAIENVGLLVKMARGIDNVDVDAVKKFGDSLKKIGKDGVDGFINAFTNAKKRVDASVKDFIGAFLDGLKSKKGTPESNEEGTVLGEISKMVSECLSVINAKRVNFEFVGKYVVEGFAKGISDNKYVAEAAARKAAEDALLAAKDRLKEQSPSKEFYEVGHFAVLGMANALNDGSKIIYDASYGSAGNAVSGIKKAIIGISDMIESDIDTQPTIRPVLDLSDIQNGTSKMNQMLGNRNLTLSAATAGAISSDISVEMSTRTPNKENELLGKISDLLEGMDSKMSDEDETAPFVMNIENFNNNTDQDIDQLTDELSVRLATKINRKKATFR